MRLILEELVTLASVGVAADPCRADDNKLPKEGAAILRKATEFEVLSLEPSLVTVEGKDVFHGYKTPGKTAVKEKTGKALVESLEKGMDGTIDPASCFNPRHGQRATFDGQTVDPVVCFECRQFNVFVGGGEKGRWLLIDKTPEKALDSVPTDGGIPKAG